MKEHRSDKQHIDLHATLARIHILGRGGVPFNGCGSLSWRFEESPIPLRTAAARGAAVCIGVHRSMIVLPPSNVEAFVVERREGDDMKRYAVTNHSTGVTHELCDTLAEAICSAVRFQDTGGHPAIIDSQGSGRIAVEISDVIEVEAVLGRDLGSEHMKHSATIEELLKAARKTAPKKQIYHWDVGDSSL